MVVGWFTDGWHVRGRKARMLMCKTLIGFSSQAAGARATLREYDPNNWAEIMRSSKSRLKSMLQWDAEKAHGISAYAKAGSRITRRRLTSSSSLTAG